MNPPVPPGPEPDPDPPGPGPDPPEPATTYDLNCTCTFATDTQNVRLQFTLYYKAAAESEWVSCDSHEFYSDTSSSGSHLIALNNIPEGCHSVKLNIGTLSTVYAASMKHPNDATYVTSLTWGSGNDGWNQDVDTDIVIKVERDD